MKPANRLPVEAYTSSQFFDLEQQHIFSTTWAFAGFVEELAKEGDYLSVQAGVNNLFVIKGKAGNLLAFHNMCSHRGTQLVEDKGHLSNKLVCPYHDWTYDLTGNLLFIPKAKQEFSGLDKSCHSLKKANVGIWRGMIWLHPDVNSMSVAKWFEPIADQLGPHEVEQLQEAKDSVVVEEIKANWKLVVENYIDHYHLAHLHSGTLNMYDHKKAEYGFVGKHFSFWEPFVKSYQENIEVNSPYPLIYKPDDVQQGAWVPMLFPGIGLAETESSWSIFQIVPLAVDRTKVIIRTKVKNCSTFEYIKQSISSANYWSQKVKAKNAKYGSDHPLGSADFLQEDIYVCEQLQKSLLSAYFSFGPSAKIGELPIREHQQIVWQIISPYWS